MLTKYEKTNISPFIYRGAEEPRENSTNIAHLPETNKSRGLRRAGNLCEIGAASCLNFGVVSTLHLLQVNPVGMILAVGVGHFYLTATAAGESSDRLLTNLMSGASASLSLLCGLSEPVGEWWEASQSKQATLLELQPKTSPMPGTTMLLLLLVGVMAIGYWLLGGRRRTS